MYLSISPAPDRLRRKVNGQSGDQLWQKVAGEAHETTRVGPGDRLNVLTRLTAGAADPRRDAPFALSNPDPEIDPLVARERGAAFAADGKGINNVLAFPGLFKGALAARVTQFSDRMLMAAAEAIAQLARPDELVPDPLDKSVHDRVATAVRSAAGEAEIVF